MIDSTGIKAEGEGEWNTHKHGGSKRRIRRKIHVRIDKETLVVRVVDFTNRNGRNAPVLPDLLNQIPSDQEISSVNADGAYETRECDEAIAARNAHVVNPTRKSTSFWKPASARTIDRNKAVSGQLYLGLTLWRW